MLVEILIFQLHQTSLPRHIIIDLIIGCVKHNDQWGRSKDDKTIRTIIHIPFVPANQRLDYHRQQLAWTERETVRTRFLSEWDSFGQPNKRRPSQFEHQSIRKESWLTQRLYQWSIWDTQPGKVYTYTNVLRQFNMVTNQNECRRLKDRGRFFDFWWLRRARYMKFTEEYVMCTEK